MSREYRCEYWGTAVYTLGGDRDAVIPGLRRILDDDEIAERVHSLHATPTSETEIVVMVPRRSEDRERDEKAFHAYVYAVWGGNESPSAYVERALIQLEQDRARIARRMTESRL